jgi:hypothetical protein
MRGRRDVRESPAPSRRRAPLKHPHDHDDALRVSLSPAPSSAGPVEARTPPATPRRSFSHRRRQAPAQLKQPNPSDACTRSRGPTGDAVRRRLRAARDVWTHRPYVPVPLKHSWERRRDHGIVVPSPGRSALDPPVLRDRRRERLRVGQEADAPLVGQCHPAVPQQLARGEVVVHAVEPCFRCPMIHRRRETPPPLKRRHGRALERRHRHHRRPVCAGSVEARRSSVRACSHRASSAPSGTGSVEATPGYGDRSNAEQSPVPSSAGSVEAVR